MFRIRRTDSMPSPCHVKSIMVSVLLTFICWLDSRSTRGSRNCFFCSVQQICIICVVEKHVVTILGSAKQSLSRHQRDANFGSCRQISAPAASTNHETLEKCSVFFFPDCFLVWSGFFWTSLRFLWVGLPDIWHRFAMGWHTCLPFRGCKAPLKKKMVVVQRPCIRWRKKVSF